MNVFALRSGFAELRHVVRHAFGRLGAVESSFIPDMEYSKVFRTARIWVGVYAVVMTLAVGLHSLLPLTRLPSFYGA